MLTYVLRRLAYTIPVLLVASILVFFFVSLTTDPLARLRSGRTDPGTIEREEKRLGLDRPLPVQYWNWLKDFVTGDWGESFISRRSVTGEIRSALWATLQLIVWAVLLSALVAIATGVYSAWRQYSKLDYVMTGFSFIGIAMPTAFFGLLAIQLLSYELREVFNLEQPLFYSVGISSANPQPFDYPRHLALPVIVLCVQLIASWSRYQRAAMLDVKNADYIRTARAKGVREWKVIVRHGLRNALIPLTTIMAIDIGALFSGLIVTEVIFSWPGMGRLLTSSLLQGDIPIVLPWMIVTAAFIIFANLLADVLYGVLDPRIRLS
jgi:peptide/nickel transport system permease protein